MGRKVAALASLLAVLSLSLGLVAWMLAGVAEHPGLPRDVGPLPPWFAGTTPSRGAAPAGALAAAPAPAPETPPGGAADGSGEVQVVGPEVVVTLEEYRLVPDRIRVRPGQPSITFVLRNEGRFAHNFRVRGPGVDAAASKFGPGRTVRLEVALPPGEYHISCPLSNHDQRGMHGTLLVAADRKGG